MSEEMNNIPTENTNNTSDVIDQEEEYREWLIFAQTDYESAKYLDGAPFYPRPLNVICYHCQQYRKTNDIVLN